MHNHGKSDERFLFPKFPCGVILWHIGEGDVPNPICRRKNPVRANSAAAFVDAPQRNGSTGIWTSQIRLIRGNKNAEVLCETKCVLIRNDSSRNRRCVVPVLE